MLNCSSYAIIERIKPKLMVRLAFLTLLCSLSLNLVAQQLEKAQLVSGPMPGYSDMKEVGIWLQLDGPGEVFLEYWPASSPEKRERTSSHHCMPGQAYTARIAVMDLEPGMAYEYEVYINDEAVTHSSTLEFQTQTLWQHRSDPPPFDLALGSCTYINEERYDRPGTPYGSGYSIFDRIADQEPDLMLWLGDNIYLREPD